MYLCSKNTNNSAITETKGLNKSKKIKKSRIMHDE